MSSRASSPAGSGRSRSSSPAGSRSRSGSPGGRSRSGSRASSRSSRRSVGSRSRSRSSVGSRSSRSSSPRFVSRTPSPASGAENRRKSGSGSDSSRKSDDSERTKKKVKAKDRKVSKAMAAKGGGGKAKGKGKAASDEGEVSSDDEEKEFDDGLDDDLIGDDADRARLEELTEKEREEELFKRAENRENLRKRFEIQKKLKLQAKKDKQAKREAGEASEGEASGSEEDQDVSKDDDADEAAAIAAAAEEDEYDRHTDSKYRSQDRQKKIEEKRFDKKSDALTQLRQKREEKERRERERKEKEDRNAKKSGSGGSGEDTDSDDEGGRRDRRSRSRSRSSSGSSRRSSRSSSASSRSSSGSEPDRGRRSRKSKSPELRFVEKLEDLEPIRLSRFKLERFVHLPHFKRLVTGCFVRIGIGLNQGRHIYRLAEIAEVMETAKVYQLGKVRTNLGFKLRHGKDVRMYRLEFVSNTQMSPSEYLKWREAIDQANMAVPSLDFVKDKSKEIQGAVNYKWKDNDIDKMIATKERFQKNPKNYAMFKSRLQREKDLARDAGEEEKAKQLEDQLADLEERAEELDKKRTSSIATVALINDRNRKANVSKAEEAIRQEIIRTKREGKESNPFTRRKCNPRMVTKPTIQTSADLNRALAEKENQEKQKADAAAAAKARSDGPPNKKAKTDEGADASKEDLFDAHDFDIEIDVGDMGGPTPGGPTLAAMKPMGGGSGGGAGVGPGAAGRIDPGPSKKSLNLDAYKKKRGLI